MANFFKNVGNVIKHGDRAGHKALRAKRQLVKSKRAAKHGNMKRAEQMAAKAYKSGKQSVKQGMRAKHAAVRSGKQLGKAGVAVATRNPVGLATAFVE